MKLKIIFLILLCVVPTSLVFTEEECLCILQFKSEPKDAPISEKLLLEMQQKCTQGTQCTIPVKGNSTNIWYPYTNGYLTKQHLQAYRQIAKNYNCSHLLLGMLTREKSVIKIGVKLFGAKENKILYASSEEMESDEDIPTTTQSILQRVVMALKNELPKIADFNPSKGTEKNAVTLQWNCTTTCEKYSIYRTSKKQNSYELIETTKKGLFRDTTVLEGIKYYYKIIPQQKDIQGEAQITWGYAQPNNPPSLLLNDILNAKNKPRQDSNNLAQQKHHLELMDEYYEGYFMTSLIFMIGKVYINKGELIVYRDFTHYTLDRDNRTVYMYKPGMVVKFYSKRLFRFMRDMRRENIPEEELLPRIINNGIVYCVRSGETEKTEPDGITRFIPTFEAVGFSTEYFRDYKGWRSNTTIFATSDEALEKRIKQAQKEHQ